MAAKDWQCSLDGIKNRIIYLYNSLEGSDCEFVVGDEKEICKAHKFILSTASPVFEKMFCGTFNEEGAVHIPDTEPKSFASMLKYIYTDDADIKTGDEAFRLYYLADKYMLPHLGTHCTDYIQKNVEISDVCRAYEFAKLFNLNGLIKFCKKTIVKNTSLVLQNPNFLNIQKETLLMILRQNSLNITSEIVLYHAVMKWVLAETIRKDMKDKEHIKCLYEEILTKIRFVTMEPEEFAEGPAICEYISADDLCHIFINLSSSNPKKSYPEKYKVLNWNKCRCVITQACNIDLCYLHQTHLRSSHHRHVLLTKRPKRHWECYHKSKPIIQINKCYCHSNWSGGEEDVRKKLRREFDESVYRYGGPNIGGVPGRIAGVPGRIAGVPIIGGGGPTIGGGLYWEADYYRIDN